MTRLEALLIFHAAWWPFVAWMAYRWVRLVLEIRRESRDIAEWVPWSVAVVCLSCEAVHQRAGVCPGCGGGPSWPLARWLDREAA